MHHCPRAAACNSLVKPRQTCLVCCRPAKPCSFQLHLHASELSLAAIRSRLHIRTGMSESEARRVVPGESLGQASDTATAGAGVYVKDGELRASLLGRVQTHAVEVDGKNTCVTSVVQSKGALAVPTEGSVILGRVSRITSAIASIDILIVDGQVAEGSFQGMLRKEHVRQSEVDAVAMHDCFRPGDIVRASVVSLGDRRSYFISTQGPEFGVVHAESAAGFALVPQSGQAMQCTGTGMVEPRKVAKIDA